MEVVVLAHDADQIAVELGFDWVVPSHYTLRVDVVSKTPQGTQHRRRPSRPRWKSFRCRRLTLEGGCRVTFWYAGFGGQRGWTGGRLRRRGGWSALRVKWRIGRRGSCMGLMCLMGPRIG
ncbi:hypothetical protein BD310DRAFT_926843 [Dichomitus squalens]|uniref:Uncharacterized protein n=1 Tax=Dichomitus squalens TaxID=114155 RepID=A0A4V2K845_9APHY|nr:hypothetical protein BD310DRAFT_926843 [Dichomitus squalens]